MGMCPNTWGRVWHSVEHLVLWVYHCHITLVFLWPFWVGALRMQCIILFADITSLNDTVTSQCHMCIGHMTFYYKRAANTSVGGSCLLFIRSSGFTLSPETCMWLVSNTCRLRHIWVGAYFLKQ